MTIRAQGILDVLRQGNLAALLLPLLLVAAGWAARARLSRKTITYRWHGVALAHPAGWTVAERSSEPGAGDSVVLTDLLGPGRIKPRVTLRIAPVPVPPPPPAADAPPAEAGAAAPEAPVVPAPGSAPAVAQTFTNRLPLYYEIGASQVQVGSQAGPVGATRIDAAFAFTPRAVPGRKGDIPVVMRSIDLVWLRGADALSVQVAAPIEDFEAQRPVLEAIVDSLRIDSPGAPAAPAQPDPTPVAAAEAEADVQAVTVTGQVVDAESGLAVPGAIVLFLSPGTSVADISDDNLTANAYTTGLADSDGHFASNRALGRAAHYGVMVVADGYRWIGSDDGVTIEGDTPEHYDVGPVRLRRR